MRTPAYATAFLVALTIATTATSDDFSALLADLSFGDVTSTSDPLTPTSPPAQDQFQRAPAAVSSEPSPSEITMPDIALPQVALETPVSTVPSRSQSMPTKSNDQVDFDAAFALQDSRVAAQPAGHLFHHGGSKGCDEEFVCTPHTPPSLPSSTFYQYFRSNKCNSHVWDGYRQRCRHANAHLNGTCDCFKEKECSDCGIVYDAPVVECQTGCNGARRRLELPRKLLPVRKECCDQESVNDCHSCDAPLDS